MKTEDTTAQASAATITEKELWALFLQTPIRQLSISRLGVVAQDYTPEDHLADPGIYGEIDGISHLVAESLQDDEHPGESLGNLITDLENYILILKRVSGDFESFKAVCLAEPEEADASDAAAYKAWERAMQEAEENPRYRLPEIDADEFWSNWTEADFIEDASA